MNTHLPPPTDADLKRAETLRSFSLKAGSDSSSPPEQNVRRRAHPVLVPAFVLACLSAAAAGVFLLGGGPEAPVPIMDISQAPNPAADPPGSQRAAGPAREITGSGFVVAPQAVAVFSKYEGGISHVFVEVGDRVAAGDVLVTLADAGAGFSLEQAILAQEAAVLQRSARAIRLAQAKAALDRQVVLAAHEVIARQTLDDTRSAHEAAQNAVEQADQALAAAGLLVRIAGERLEALTLRAPLSGTITRLDARPGDTVLSRADSVRENQSLLTITNTDGLVIDADVAETQLGRLRPGLSGEAVLDGFPDQPFPVTVQRLAPVASAEKGTITLRLQLAHPPAGIRPNMAARIRLSLSQPGDQTP
jgi:RND family efflux transporter MFP subunit